MQQDFSQLYAQLGIGPDCTLEQFKHAYRRRVSELHPDRKPAGSRGDDPSTDLLGQLISLHAAAMQFHRQHGRLPGALPVLDRKPQPMPEVSPPVDPLSPTPHPRNPPPAPLPAPSSRRYLLGALLVLLVGGYLFNLAREQLPSPGEAEAGDASKPAIAMSSSAPVLRIGMEKPAVLEIQGNPTFSNDELWEYGPSWIRFEDDHVVEWHSSPLYPLRIAIPARVPTAMESATGR